MSDSKVTEIENVRSENKTLNIYLAGPCSSDCRTMMRGIADRIRSIKYIPNNDDVPRISVYCPFEYKVDNAWSLSQESWAKKVFDNDITELEKADVVIVITSGRHGTAGTNWEHGYAYAKNKKIFVFQYTEDSTSIMTYTGSQRFEVCKMEDLESAVSDAVYNLLISGEKQDNKLIYDDFYKKSACPTVLT